MEKSILFSQINTDELISEITSHVISGIEQLLEEKATSLRDADEWLTAKEVQEYLKISSVTLWKYDKQGITLPHKVGRRKRYNREEVKRCFIKLESS